ncbi:MAG: hypothetical protein HYR74_10145 [Candidatus Eisenbacteria bacterium]|nr:hypothetical protein [Candidatus Eisenbacteria bacterium]
MSQFGSLGSNPGQLSAPRGINFDHSGNLYVADASNKRIQVFNTGLGPMCSIDDTGNFYDPLSDLLWAYPARDGSVYVNYRETELRWFLPGGRGRLNLSWNDCSTLETTNRTFACNSNIGSNVIVVSYDPGIDIPDLVGNDIAIDLQTASTTLDPWWQLFNPGQCRTTSLSSSADFTAGPSTCADFWKGLAQGGIGSYTVNVNRARILAFWAVPNANAGPVTAGTEYYSCKLTINNTKTVGTGACGGCTQGVCLVLSVVALDYHPNAPLQKSIQDPINQNWITWQSGTGIPGGCYGATPAQKKTWGQIKALYR